MSKYTVSGGLGFIGSNLTIKLIKQGHKVIVIDNMDTGRLSNLDEIKKNKNLTIFKSDITNLKEMIVMCKGVDGIFHLAAKARIQRSIDEPIDTQKTNVRGTLNMFLAAKEQDIKKIVYASSSSIYGDQDTHIMKEDMIPNPMSPYALHKCMNERHAELLSKKCGITTVGMRFFNVYGKNQITEGAYSLVIGKFLKQKAEGRKMTIYGDGEQTRSYTAVEDVVEAMLLAMNKEDLVESSVFNIGMNQETSVNEIAELIGGEVDHILPNPRGEFEEKRKMADNSLAKKILGWEPKISIEEGIVKLLNASTTSTTST